MLVADLANKNSVTRLDTYTLQAGLQAAATVHAGKTSSTS